MDAMLLVYILQENYRNRSRLFVICYGSEF